jgi:ubiquinone/menaquinone biosynthesis C-methylase UbiE
MDNSNSNEYHYANTRTVLFDKTSRFEKAEKIFLILKEKYAHQLVEATVLDIGCSAGLIDYWLANKVRYIYGIDIDNDIISSVKNVEKQVDNFMFIYSEGDKLCFKDNTFDIVISNIMYYLLPHHAQQKMMEEISRCLKPEGLCYFATPNRLLILDGKYRLPFLCWLPIRLGRMYVKIFAPSKEYNEYYKTLFGLRKMIKKYFVWQDITLEILDHPHKYKFMYNQHKFIQGGIRILARLFYLFMPNYIFILRKREKNI